MNLAAVIANALSNPQFADDIAQLFQIPDSVEFGHRVNGDRIEADTVILTTPSVQLDFLWAFGHLIRKGKLSLSPSSSEFGVRDPSVLQFIQRLSAGLKELNIDAWMGDLTSPNAIHFDKVKKFGLKLLDKQRATHNGRPVRLTFDGLEAFDIDSIVCDATVQLVRQFIAANGALKSLAFPVWNDLSIVTEILRSVEATHTIREVTVNATNGLGPHGAELMESVEHLQAITFVIGDAVDSTHNYDAVIGQIKGGWRKVRDVVDTAYVGQGVSRNVTIEREPRSNCSEDDAFFDDEGPSWG